MSETSPVALLISGDLFFTSKITGTAQALGFGADVQASLPESVGAEYQLLILDLSTPGLSPAEVMARFPEANRPAVIAFGPHVEKARLEEAMEAGCQEVLPRSRFSAELPEILRRYLGS